MRTQPMDLGKAMLQGCWKICYIRIKKEISRSYCSRSTTIFFGYPKEILLQQHCLIGLPEIYNVTKDIVTLVFACLSIVENSSTDEG